MNDCIGIILARTGSRRVKNKNFLKINSKYIFEYPIIEANKTNRFSKIIISANKKKNQLIKNLSKKKEYKNKLIFHGRSNEMSKNNFHMIKIVKHILNSYLVKNLKFRYVFMIYSTAILIKKNDFLNMLKIIKKNEKNNNGCSVQTICKYPAPIEWALKIDKKNLLTNKFKYKIKSSDQYNNYFYDTGGLHLFNKDYFKENNKKKFLGYDIGKVRGIDVDDEQDLEIAKSVFLKNIN